ncbi:MAG TPA: hypothetical protein VGE21_08460 [Flavobacteriales bacterium]
MDFANIRSRLNEAFGNYLDSVLSALPGLAGGLLLLLFGYALAYVARWSVRRILRSSGLVNLAQRAGFERLLERFGGTAEVFSRVVFYLILLFFVMATAEVMEFTLVVDGLRRFFSYLPRLLTAVAVLLFGIWTAQRIRTVMDGLSTTMGLSGGRVIGTLLFGIVVLFMSITALNVAGVDTTLITSNILLLMAGLLLSFAIAYGFASRDILTNILGSFYGRDRFSTGMRLRIGSDEGVVEKIDSIALTLRCADRSIVIPASRLVTERIEVLDLLTVDKKEQHAA